MFAIPFPTIDPILVEIGPFAIRWYALAYVVGIVLGWRYMLLVIKRPPARMTARDVDDLVVWVTLGVILGGRLGYVLFYKPGYFIHDPLQIFVVWEGGMSFHGGLIGVILALWLFGRSRGYGFRGVGDPFVCSVPIGLLLGRIANFVNAELYGRPTDVSWAFVFPSDPTKLPRHPSQLYEAFLEGAVLFAILYWMAFHTRALQKPGLLGGVFLTGYGISRIIVELFRSPDAHMPDFPLGITMGQILSLPVLLAGLYLIRMAMSEAQARK